MIRRAVVAACLLAACQGDSAGEPTENTAPALDNACVGAACEAPVAVGAADGGVASGIGCRVPGEGCPCAEGQAPLPCVLPPEPTGEGEVVCTEGTRHCRGGRYGACEDLHSYRLDADSVQSAIVDNTLVEPCNPCARNCYLVRDALDPVEGLAEASDGCMDWAPGGGLELELSDEAPGGCGVLDPPDGGVPSAGDAGAPDGGTPSADVCVPRRCLRQVYACGDCLDNDGDGLTDDEDPDCLGACDNNEEGYWGDIPGQNNAPCRQDCYFDQDTGHGNDDCIYDVRCDALEPVAGCGHDPEVQIPGTPLGCAELQSAQSEQCTEVCRPLTPPGCDCFGCCELPAESGRFVWLPTVDEDGERTCTLDSALDDEACRPCTPVMGCFQPCERCELCLGKTELPADCVSTQPTYVESGVYTQRLDAAGCTGTMRPDWGRLSFTADVPTGTLIEFLGCGTDQAEQSCTPRLLGRVDSMGACNTDTDCPHGFCGVDARCQRVLGPPCAGPCPGNGSCLEGTCVYPDSSLDVAAALAPGENLRVHLQLEVRLWSDPTALETPILYGWDVMYNCQNAE